MAKNAAENLNEDEADFEADAEKELDGVEGEGDEEGAKKGKLKLIIIGAAALVVILAGAAAAYFFLFAGNAKEGVEEVIVAPETYFYELPIMTVNLSSEVNSEQFLKLSVALEVADEEMAAAIEPRINRVLDAFQVYLRELRRSDLEGSAGIYRLKEELRRRVNLALYPVQVDSILFKEILVQ